MKSISLDVVFNTDSEYHMYFTQKPIFINLSQEISAHLWTFLLWLTYFHDLSIFFMFFLIFEAIFWKSMKNCTDPYIPLFGSRFLCPPIGSQGCPKPGFLLIFWVFNSKTNQNSASNNSFYDVCEFCSNKKMTLRIDKV